MRVNYNISAIIARNALNNNDSRLTSSTQRLSSGYKINQASDDSAGLAISLKMKAQIRSLERANINANDGISVVNTADGAMAEMHDILQRMNELAIQAANGTNADTDREQIQLEIDQLIQEVDRISETTQFNAQNLLDGSFAYKGYTNSENIKVTSYSDGVTSGTYALKQLQYDYFVDVTQDYDTYVENKPDGVTTEDKHFAAVSADAIKDGLYTTKQKGIHTFPEGSRVVLSDENIYIKAENDFEVKLTVNERTPVANTATTTISKTQITTDTFQNVTVYSPDGSAKYNLASLTRQISKDEQNNETTKYFTGSEREGLRYLDDDLFTCYKEVYPNAKSVNAKSCEFKSDTSTKTYVNSDGVTTTYSYSETTLVLKVDVTDENGATTEETMSLKVAMPLPEEYNQKISEKRKEDPSRTYEELYNLYYPQYEADLPDKVKESNINNYLFSHTETIKTTYTVGNEDDPILLNLTGMGPMRLQVGANEGQVIQIEIPALQAVNFDIDDLDISTEEKATKAIDKIGAAINHLSEIRAKIGAYSNRIEHTITNLDTTVENMTAAYSRIMDVDMAEEMTEYSTMQVLVQSATSMLAQANERPQSVLQLIQ